MRLPVAAALLACVPLLAACTASEQSTPQPAKAAAGEKAAPVAGEVAAAYVPPEGAVVVGEPLEGKERVTLAEVRAHPEKYFDQTLFVEATVVDVCQSKGCWMTVKDGDVEPIWVAWGTGCGGKYAFPKDSAGRRVLVQGSFYEKEISEKDAEHLAEESQGLKADEIAGKTYEMNATAVVVLPTEKKADA
jgi:hypothetical protein